MLECHIVLLEKFVLESYLEIPHASQITDHWLLHAQTVVSPSKAWNQPISLLMRHDTVKDVSLLRGISSNVAISSNLLIWNEFWALQLAKPRAHSSLLFSQFRSLLKATVVLLPLLGLTWVFGLLTVDQNTAFFAWIFTILNSLQVLKFQNKIASC